MADKVESPFTVHLSKQQAWALTQAAVRAGGFDKLTNADIERAKNSGDTQAAAESKRSKYRNVRTVVDGETFDSKREAQYWHELKLREKAGEIGHLKRQVEYELRCPIDMWPPEREAVVSRYIADFVYCDLPERPQGGFTVHVVDAKGKRTALYQLKKKWLELQSGIVIEEV